jgi:hypothetical protein
MRRPRARGLADQLALPSPFDAHALCRDIAAQRSRPIVLAPMPLAAVGPCGLWLATDAADYICYERNTSPFHQDHIVLHEVGHILCGHDGAERLDVTLGGLFPDLAADTLRIMLARQHRGYLPAHETEAELFAYAILERAGRSRPEHARTGADPDSPAGRLSRILEDFR